MSTEPKNFADIRKQVLGHSSRFQLINQELSESLLFRSTRGFGNMTGRDIADLLFMNTMLIYVLAQESDTEEYARDYAYETVQYGTYSLFRTHATDLYLLAYTVIVDHSTQISLTNHSDSRNFLNSLNFNRRQHMDFLRRIATGQDTSGQVVSYLYRLETQLKIVNPRFRTWRRMAVAWNSLSSREKNNFYYVINTELMRITHGGARNAELLKYGIRKLAKNKENLDK